jgi:hypothetical protein
MAMKEYKWPIIMLIAVLLAGLTIWLPRQCSSMGRGDTKYTPRGDIQPDIDTDLILNLGESESSEEEKDN